jgi:transposase-like protein
MAVVRYCAGRSWQCCPVHLALDRLVKVPKGTQDVVSAVLRPLCVQTDAHTANQQWDQVTRILS